MVLLHYQKDPMCAAIFVRYSKHSNLLFASVQRMFTANSRSVELTEQTFNKTSAVFAELKGPIGICIDFNCHVQKDVISSHMRKGIVWAISLMFQSIFCTYIQVNVLNNKYMP